MKRRARELRREASLPERAYLCDRGLSVFRVTIDDLIQDKDAVAEAILAAAERCAQRHPALTPNPSPGGRGEPE